MTLTTHQRLASRYLGLLIDEATQSRLKIHGFHDEGEVIDDADELFVPTATVKGLRAVEEA